MAYKNRDTFLGAGGGAIIGDAIFPGLGTAVGLLLGGYGGKKHAEMSAERRRSRSEKETGYRGERRRGRRDSDGWDEVSGTVKKGWAIR